MRDDLFIAAGEESVELGLQNHREKGVAEQNIVKSDGAHESVGDKPPCKYFNTSNGCWNGFKCRFSHDVDAPYAKRRKA
nr:zinc finger CCCH domain-containing protein 6-like [Ipomoea batatas]